MTLSRVENGAQPDLATFLRLCAWLRVPPQTFFITAAPRDTNTPEAVAHYLLSDPRLERDAASRIAAVVRDMYVALAGDPPETPTVACHLRAAATLRPGAASRLGSMLHDMQNRLQELESDGAL
jgi:transcriptional regulator with XRE-family HTH domain